MNVKFYICKDTENTLSKNLLSELSKTGNLLEDCSIIKPVIEFNFKPVGYNYAYIPEFARYYYIRNIINTGASTWRVEFEVDPLMSFKAEIKASPCIAAKSSNVYNLYLNDPNYKCYQDDIILFQNFSGGFSSNYSRFVLTVLGDKVAAT